MGNETETEGAPDRPQRSGAGRPVPLWLAAAVAALALLGGFLLGRPAVPLDTSADAGFLRDMSVHHSQAVDMSIVILEKTDEPKLRTVAQDIARTQQSQIGRMQGWLVQWGLNIRGAQPPMTWMAGHGAHGSGEAPDTMPGWASEEEMKRLEEAEGVEAEVLFLQLMIDHHRGGIDMAEAAVSAADRPLVTDFAAGMAEAQQAEIELMEDMLADRGA
ncbi:uncharacterized protein (DUF305 family) [Nocardiopsis mwathae]|uniref:Uncharacterized protein (DUF305 family) n=1 Tax=Nocardiopsis mwathae TaxID=1472723 RepID=A0A7W9YJ32_9ACTN|nr:uncharacterized protein (DUF305 family) [Nocardiopsis mwathae]